MGHTPSAASAADLLRSATPSSTSKWTVSAIAILVLALTVCTIPCSAMDGGAAAPGHAWTPGRHITPMEESGHPSIMDGAFGAPYWRALRPRMIQFLVANYLWDRMLDAGAAAPKPDSRSA